MIEQLQGNDLAQKWSKYGADSDLPTTAIAQSLKYTSLLKLTKKHRTYSVVVATSSLTASFIKA